MAQKRRTAKIESKQMKPAMRFKPGVLICIVLITFLFCFVLYMISAISQKDYWEKEIVPTLTSEQTEDPERKTKSDVTNPVPSSERADESRIQTCAFIGEVNTFSNYYPLTSGLAFTDTLTEMSESRMRSIARSIGSAAPTAVYLWYQCPQDLDAAAETYTTLVNTLQEQAPGIPVYVLTAFPSADASQTQRIDTWNAALFALSDERGLHYVDISTMLKANDGTLSENYQDEEMLYQTVCDQILSHIAD